MSLFKTWAELRQESRYTRPKASGFNVSSAYVLKSDMDLCSPVDAGTSIQHALPSATKYSEETHVKESQQIFITIHHAVMPACFFNSSNRFPVTGLVSISAGLSSPGT